MQSLSVQWPPAGRYILAVSGGADSMVLLDIFTQAVAGHGYHLVVAHFDHGLRPDSTLDRDFVRAAATRVGWAFESHRGRLSSGDEATARTARHAWLEQVRRRHQASAILTAHHQDDLIETSLLNLARGTGRLGLSPMTTSPTIFRPLLQTPRTALRAYAAAHNIAWREDSTNLNTTNPRNFLRHRLLPSATPSWRRRYLELIAIQAELNKKIDQSISVILDAARLDADTYSFDRTWLRSITLPEIQELLLAAARHLVLGIQLDRPLLREAAYFCQNGHSRKFRPIRQGLVLILSREAARLTTKPPH